MPSSTSYTQSFSLSLEGFKLGVTRMNGTDIVHHAMLGEKLYAIIEDDAKAHGEVYDGKNFNKVINAINTNKIQVHFLIAAHENCHPNFIGGAIQLSTIMTEWNGADFEHYPAIYIEDFCLSPKLLKEFLRRVPDARFPKGTDLGTYFMHEIIKACATNAYEDLPEGLVAKGFIAEYAANNSKIVRILNGFRSDLGTSEKGSILQLDPLALNIKNRKPALVKTEAVKFKASDINALPNMFVTSWSGDNGRQRIVASYTESISTFTGDPIMRVQFTGNGNIPDGEKLKDVLVALISAGNAEISKRNIQGTTTLPTLCLHALNEKEIVEALKDLGAVTRFLGSNPTLPIVTNFAKAPDNALNFKLPTAKQFVVVESTENTSVRPKAGVELRPGQYTAV